METRSEEKNDGPQRYIKSFALNRFRAFTDNEQEIYRNGIDKYAVDINEIEAVITTKRVIFELGYGTGDFLAEFFRKNNDQNTIIIGCEVYKRGILSLIKKLKSNNTQNVRLFIEDGRLLLEKMPDDSINEFYLLFPDPWPKKRHHKRRIVNERFLDLLYKKCSNDALITIATDIDSYAEQISDLLNSSKMFTYNIKRDNDVFYTKFSMKAKDKGNNVSIFSINKNELLS